ncbi:MAG: helix-turn-helix domain-containing protein [Spirochaetota bacterium]
MGEAFESIMRGLSEVKAHHEGKLKLKTTAIEIAPLPVYDAKAVKALRLALGLSQTVFAQVLGVAKKTVEAWEAGRNIPSGAACRFLEVLRKDNGFILRERIMTYAAQTAGGRTSAKRPSATSRVSAKKAPKAKVSKTTVVR